MWTLTKKLFLLSIFLMYCLTGCTRTDRANTSPATYRLRVVTTLFPLYDFARTIGGDKAEVTLLMPPGVEPHGFEPKPDDVIRINKAGLFVYTSPFMEPWAAKIISGLDVSRVRVVEAGSGLSYLPASNDGDDHHEHSHEHHAAKLDPHVWLDFGNAGQMVDTILAAFVVQDTVNAPYYRRNAAELKNRLNALDQQYRDTLATCSSRTLLHGGHYTFGYLARRYSLQYRSLSGVSSESEPSATQMIALVRQIKRSGVRYLFAEELLSPRVTETLAAEAGVSVLPLHGAHNISRDEFQRGVSYIDLMQRNLINLRKGLACTK